MRAGVRPRKKVILRQGIPIYTIPNFREKLLWRLAELHLSYRDLADRMGVIYRRVMAIVSARRIEERTLARVSLALEWPIERWRRRLRVPVSPARTAFRRLLRVADKRAEKKMAPGKFSLPSVTR